MMKKITYGFAFFLVIYTAPLLAAEGMSLDVLQFLERRDVRFRMFPTREAGSALMKSKVRYEEGQSRIEVEYEKFKPAVLFGGDVTCYVLWAINRDGAPQNLGELWVRPGNESEKHQFSTGLRNFSLLVTAEPYYQVEIPSELVIFWNDGQADPPVPTTEIFFDRFREPPRTGVNTLTNVRYDGDKPLDLVQAEKVFEAAENLAADKYAPEIFSQAQIALQQATQMYDRDRNEGAQRFARRSVAASNEAIRLAKRKIEVEEIEAQIERRQREMSQLEERAAQAEATLEQTRRDREEALARIAEAKDQLEQLQTERSNLQDQMADLRRSQAELERTMENLQQDKAELEREKAALQRDRAELQSRLQGALSQVADTRESARGLIVNLPDILFDVGEATLKSEARMALAKLAGILLIMEDLNLRIEGHTDSTGSPSFNQRLSERRADAVYDLLVGEGVRGSRITTEGYGMERPIADNSTAEGRRQNRRVEIIIGEGEVAEERL